MFRRSGLACVCALLVTACELTPTQIVVVVGADFEPTRVEARVHDVSGAAPDAGRHVFEIGGVMVADRVVLPFSFGVSPPHGNPGREVRVELSADAPDDSRVEARARVAFVPQKVIRLVMVLSEACGGVACREGETCAVVRGEPQCVSDERMDLEPVSPGTELDGALPDSGLPDSGVPDSGLPDGGASTCEVFPQRGCPAGEACYWDGVGVSCMASGEGRLGDSCSAESDCAAGLACFLSSGGGICAPYCARREDCAAGGRCVRAVWSLSLGICSHPCVLSVASGCGPTQTCRSHGNEEVDTGLIVQFRTCVPDGPAPLHSRCRISVDCAEGLDCISMFGPEAPGFCEPRCSDAAVCHPTACIVTLFDGNPLPYGVCGPSCDPLVSGPPCGEDEACDVRVVRRFGGGPGVEVASCRLAGDRGLGQSCDADRRCQAQLTCRSGTCRSLCPVGSPGCTAFTGSGAYGFE